MSRWNQRFFVSTSKDNDKLHDFYREYFDKPGGRRSARAIPPQRQPVLDPPNLHSTLGFNFMRIPKGSRAISRRGRRREQSWNNRFNVMLSKDNRHIHSTRREYFDSPRPFDETPLAATASLPRLPHACTYQSLRSTASLKSLESMRGTWRDSANPK